MIVAGFGFRQGASQDSLADAFARASRGQRVDRLATLSDKAEALEGFASQMGLPLIATAPDAAQSVETLTRSTASQAAKGLPSVAEATALAAAGPGAKLLAPRAISEDRMATCALALGKDHP